MHWTRKKPICPGWWWYSDHAEYGEKEPLEVTFKDASNKLYARNSTGGYDDFSKWQGWWSDAPIPEPEPLKQEGGVR